MTRLQKLLILGICCATFAGISSASVANVYIAQSAAGAGDGSSCGNAKAASFFNSSANWGSGSSQIGPGTTVHLCGTISSALTAQGNGASGNPITVLFESGAKLSTGVFPVSGALNLSGRSWVTVNGGTACGPSVTNKASCNGKIENTANGTGLSNRTDQTVGINVDGSNNITIQNMLISNIYVHSSGSDTSVSGQPLPSGIWATNATSNIEIKNSSLHDANWMLSFVGGSAMSGLNFHDLDIYNSDHCLAVGVVSQTDNNISFHDSRCHDGANWDTAANDYHHDGVHLYTTTGSGRITNAQTYNNVFDGYWGVNNTAAIFEEGPGGGEVDNTIYNNVFLQNSTSFNWNNGFINLGNLDGSNPSTTKLYNNTAVAGAGQNAYLFQLAYAVDMRGNALVTSNSSTGVVINLISNVTGTIDYNYYASPLNPFQISNAGKTFAQWQAAGRDAHGGTGTPPMNISTSTGQPSANFAGISNAQNLSNLGIATLDMDKAGNARPSAGDWDVGAFQFSTSSSSQPPAPPAGLAAVVN